MKLIVFDVYGTLLDVYSISTKCDEFAPGKGFAISKTWRMKQIDYTRLRSMHGKTKYKSFWLILKQKFASLMLVTRERLGVKDEQVETEEVKEETTDEPIVATPRKARSRSPSRARRGRSCSVACQGRWRPRRPRCRTVCFSAASSRS